MTKLLELAHMSGASIQATRSAGAAILQMGRGGIPLLAVLSDDEILGLVSMRSVVGLHPNRLLLDCPLVCVGEVLSPEMTPNDAWLKLRQARCEALPLLDKDRAEVGLVFEADLLQYLFATWDSGPAPLGCESQPLRAAVLGESGDDIELLEAALRENGCRPIHVTSFADFHVLANTEQLDIAVFSSPVNGVPSATLLRRAHRQRLLRHAGCLVVLEPTTCERYLHIVTATSATALISPLDSNAVRGTIRRICQNNRFLDEVSTLRDKVHLLARTVEATPVGITISSPKGTILYANPAEARMHGYSPEELLGQDIGVYTLPSIRKRMNVDALRRLDSRSRESWNIRKDGSCFPVRLRSAPVIDECGNLLGKVSICEDVSKEHQAQKEIALAHETLVRVLETSSDGILVTNEHDEIILANRAFLDLVNMPREEVIGKRCSEAVRADIWRECHTRQDRWYSLTNREVRIERADGTPILCLLNTNQFYEPNGGGTRLVYSFRDVTELRRLESIAATESLMDNIGFIFSGIRHEIGNPLNTIMTTANLIKSTAGRSQPHKIREYATWIHEESRRIQYLLQAFKNFSLFDQVKMEPMDLVAFVESFLSLVARDSDTRSIHITWNPTHEPVWVIADKRALHHAVLNLVTNAVQALSQTEDPEIVFSLSRLPRSGLVALKVSDNGPGISDSQISKLFKPMFSTKERGSGLGLPIVQKILSKMGADISVESQLGKGTTMTIVMREHTLRVDGTQIEHPPSSPPPNNGDSEATTATDHEDSS